MSAGPGSPIVVGQAPFDNDAGPPAFDAVARRHVLEGDPDDPKYGGHRYAMLRPGKTEFPDYWTDDEVVAAVNATVQRPELTIHSGDRTDHLKEVNRVIIRVSTYCDQGVRRFRTAYPVNGDGVSANPDDGGPPVPKPLARDVIERYR